MHPKIPQKPLVVCVGFLGSKPRHIQKYADMLSGMEVNIAPLSSKQPINATPDVIQFIPPIQTFFSPSRISQSAGDLSRLIESTLAKPAPIEPKFRKFFAHQTQPYDLTPQKLKDDIQNYQPRKIMFFCLSNNGAFGYANFLNYCKKVNPVLFKRVNSQTCGVVWDSSPTFPTPEVFQRGFVSAISTILGRKPTSTDPILTPIFSGLISWFLSNKSYSEAAQDVTNVLQYNIPYHAPQLYLITEKDDLVLPDETREFVKERSNRVKEFFARFPSFHDYHSAVSGNLRSNTLPIGNSSSSLQNATTGLPNYASKLVDEMEQSSRPISSMQSWVDIAEELKSSQEWNKSTVDQQQLQFLYQYNLQHNIIPIMQSTASISKHPWWSFSSTPRLSSSTQSTCEVDPRVHVELPTDPATAISNFEHPHLQHLASSTPHIPTLAEIQQDKYLSTPCYGENIANNAPSSLRTTSDPNDPDALGLSHCNTPTHTHLDVIFTPAYKSQYIKDNEYDKVKHLFEKAERFGDDCHHHFLFDFKDSAHVQHIRKHPEDYKALVGAFCHYAFRG